METLRVFENHIYTFVFQTSHKRTFFICWFLCTRNFYSDKLKGLSRRFVKRLNFALYKFIIPKYS